MSADVAACGGGELSAAAGIRGLAALRRAGVVVVPRRRSDTVSAVGRWLAPMMAAAGDRDDINMQALFDAATTVTKMEKPKAWWRPAPFGDEEQRSVDWVLLGQLLRRALGWDDYPEAPAG